MRGPLFCYRNGSPSASANQIHDNLKQQFWRNVGEKSSGCKRPKADKEHDFTGIPPPDARIPQLRFQGTGRIATTPNHQTIQGKHRSSKKKYLRFMLRRPYKARNIAGQSRHHRAKPKTDQESGQGTADQRAHRTKKCDASEKCLSEARHSTCQCRRHNPTL